MAKNTNLQTQGAKQTPNGINSKKFMPRAGVERMAARQWTGWSRQRLVVWVVPLFPDDKPGGTTGERARPCNPGFQHGEIKPQNLW